MRPELEALIDRKRPELVRGIKPKESFYAELISHGIFDDEEVAEIRVSMFILYCQNCIKTN